MNHLPRKRFGQHFLRDRSVIGRILRAIAPQPGERLVEIGPGRGAITGPLLEACGRLTVIELDRDLVGPLARQFGGLGELTILQGDALQTNLCDLDADDRGLRVTGNLPYNISTPLLFHLMEQAECITDMHFMLQKEVVDRMAAAPGNKDYGRLSVMIQYHCRVTPLFTIAADAFSPPPAVISAFVRLVPHAEPVVQVNDPRQLEQVVRQAFGQRRKTVRNSLRGILDETAIRSSGIDPSARPEQLALEDFARLANAAGNPL